MTRHGAGSDGDLTDEPLGADDVDAVRSGMLANLEARPKAYTRWTEAEEARLLDLIRTGKTTSEIAKEFQRSTSAVRTRARRIAFAALYGREVPDHAPETLPARSWAPDDVETLRSLIPTATSWDEIGRQIGRSPSSCRLQAEQDAFERLSSGASEQEEGESVAEVR
jgi:hypothetical protein